MINKKEIRLEAFCLGLFDLICCWHKESYLSCNMLWSREYLNLNWFTTRQLKMKHFLDVVMQFIFEVFLALTCPKFGSTGRVVFFLQSHFELVRINCLIHSWKMNYEWDAKILGLLKFWSGAISQAKWQLFIFKS